MIFLKNLTLRRSAKVLLDNVSVTLNPGEKVGLVGRNGAGKSSLFALLDRPAACRRRRFRRCRRAGASARSRRTCRRPSERATDFVLEGDTRLVEARGRAGAAPRPATTATRSARRAPARSGRAGGFDARPRAQALLLGLGFKRRRARRAGEQLLGRLAHAPATGARADVPGRPAAARRADQPPRPRRPGLAGSLAASAMPAR